MARAFLIQRWTVDFPEAPDGIAIIGAGADAGRFRQHYFDSRGVHRLYEMTLDDRVWTLSRDEPDPFPAALHRDLQRRRLDDCRPLGEGRGWSELGDGLRPDLPSPPLSRTASAAPWPAFS